MRTTLYGLSYGLTLRSQHTTLSPISGWCPSSSSLRILSQRLPPFRLFWILRRSATTADFLVWSARIQIRFSLNRCASANTLSPCSPSCHNTNIPRQPLFADFHAALTPVASGGYGTAVGTSSMPSFLLLSVPLLRAKPPLPPRPWGSSASVCNIQLSD